MSEINLTKANRIIQNLLNELKVQCNVCQTVIDRGHYGNHACNGNSNNQIQNLQKATIQQEIQVTIS
ncbi:unnamed protein product [Didymodactylos carnosus]|uniref:Uncharacterized protein n=1 Tax=Didymodactylos carnosus TaxID=1234261 RepID=A0A815FMF7_9BILA|nr:unnamed protein product [Didymodactylos carnosus]CAF1328949.1 unnamed protein product [Didymodactylos carnosus]CAF3773975.1 unnamed protein product [Didymodactylos carnosus]CAF4180970.1 unnamed protein product [Didymodactylos carnosus]